MSAPAAASLSFPPGPRSRVPGRLLLRMQREPLSFFGGIKRDHGDVAGFRIGPQPVVLLSAPDDIRDLLVTHQRNFTKGRGLERAKTMLGEGLLTSEGDVHLRQRRLVQPAFHRERIAAYGLTMAEYARRTAERWRDGETLDLHAAMMALTLAIVGKTLFDADVEGEAAEIGQALTVAVESFRLGTMPFGELLERLPLPASIRFRRAKARLDATIYRLIAERRRAPGDRGDLLSMLLLARDTEGDQGGMTNRQLRDEAMTLFLAGHETTANALAWTFHLLATHPAVEARLHAEADALGHPPTPDDLPRLDYHRAVLAESMRLFPPAWIVGRRAKEAFDVGGHRVPARAIVLASQYLVHRDPRWWPEPDAFRPERWLDAEASAQRPKFAYFPFGGGTRICIGEPFAWMEGILVLATLGQRWRLRQAPGPPVEPEPLITLRPKHGMRMILEARRQARPDERPGGAPRAPAR